MIFEKKIKNTRQNWPLKPLFPIEHERIFSKPMLFTLIILSVITFTNCSSDEKNIVGVFEFVEGEHFVKINITHIKENVFGVRLSFSNQPDKYVEGNFNSKENILYLSNGFYEFSENYNEIYINGNRTDVIPRK